MQQSDLSRRRKEAGFNGICRQFTQMLLGKAKRLVGQAIFVLEVAKKHGRIVRIKRDHEASVKVTADRVLLERGTTPGTQIRRDANLEGHLALRQHLHQVWIQLR